MPQKIIRLLLLSFLLASCGNKKSMENDRSQPTKGYSNKVNVAIAADSVFDKQIIANGLVKAINKTELRFKSSNRLNKIFVRNGERVHKGQLLAVLDHLLLANQLQKAKIALEDAKFKLGVMRIDYGYGPMDSQKAVPPDKLKILRLKSGYLAAKNALDNIQIHYDQTSIEAPISGVVANLKTKTGNYITPGEVFCTLINQEAFDVYFSILEDELPFVHQGQNVKILPYAEPDNVYKAHISEINPIVSDDGLVKIRAAIKNPDGFLMEGMHVKVYVNEPIDSVVVVPKRAVVLRSNRPVVFTLENGLAKWNYVRILYENALTYAIGKGIELGDTIIVSGNINIAHDAKVTPTLLSGNDKRDG